MPALGQGPAILKLTVRREEVYEDTLDQLAALPEAALSCPLRIQFSGEEGVDEGGLVKEFFHLVMPKFFRYGGLERVASAHGDPCMGTGAHQRPHGLFLRQPGPRAHGQRWPAVVLVLGPDGEESQGVPLVGLAGLFSFFLFFLFLSPSFSLFLSLSINPATVSPSRAAHPRCLPSQPWPAVRPGVYEPHPHLSHVSASV